MEQVVVGVADCGVASGPQAVLVTYALGSCVGLTVHDPVTAVGGMLHFMLPDSTLFREGRQENPYKFADTGIALLLERVYAEGASKRRLNVYAVGGAQISEGAGFEIGRRNYLAARRVLWKHRLMLTGEAVGGAVARTVALETATGRVFLDEAGRRRQLTPATCKKGESTWHTGS
jgi:chemotaxis protein CheD